MDPSKALSILRRHTFPTIGCTDPVAIGLAVAHACGISKGSVRRIRVRMDRNVYKDSVAVGIPGIYRAGIDLAVALAVLKGRPGDGLRLFRDVEPADIVSAEAFSRDHGILLEIDEEAAGIRIDAEVETDAGLYGALIEGGHDSLKELRIDGRTIYRAGTPGDGPPGVDPAGDGLEGLRDLAPLSLGEIEETVAALDPEELGFLVRGVAINLQAAQAGLDGHAGLGLGRALRSLSDGSTLPDSIVSRIRMLVAAAADARMGGMNVPVFGCFGSGNHGITFFVTVGEMGRFLGRSEDDIARALALGLLVVGVIKTRTGILTPHCGCAVAAGTGAAAAVTRLLGGTVGQMENAVQLMTANLTGMLCDGAKYGCALKVATSAGVAVETALLAVRTGMFVPEGNGIVGADFRKTMDNLEVLTHRGMREVDGAVLDILPAGRKPKAGAVARDAAGGGARTWVGSGQDGAGPADHSASRSTVVVAPPHTTTSTVPYSPSSSAPS